MQIQELVGVFNGDGGIRGEVAHVFDKLRGGGCALCDITHRGLRKNPQWSDVACAVAVPFDLVHRDEQGPEVAAVVDGAYPAVVALTEGGARLVMGPKDFDGLSGDAAKFLESLKAAVKRANLEWPGQ